MIDYSKMSDDEICKAAGDAIGLEWAELNQNYNGLCYWKDGDLFVFNPIRDPADAWPVVEQNKITMMHECDEWTAFGNLSIHHSGEANWEFCEYDKKPFRAAMIVFLMMQERSNGG